MYTLLMSDLFSGASVTVDAARKLVAKYAHRIEKRDERWVYIFPDTGCALVAPPSADKL